MASSGSEDDEQVQQTLLKHLAEYLDDQLGETKKKKKKNKSTKKVASVENYSEKKCNDNSNKIDSKSRIVDIGRIKKLATDAKRAKLQSPVWAKDNNSISAKMKEILKPSPKVAVTKGEKDHWNEHDEETFSEQSCSEDDHGDRDVLHATSNVQELGDEFVDDDIDTDDENGDEATTSSSQNKQLDKFKSALGITEADLREAKEKKDCADKQPGDERVVTVASKKGKKRRPPPSVVVFEDRKPTVKKKKFLEPSRDEEVSDEPEFDLHRARFEVRKFGISGLQGSDKEAGMVDLLVKLGAKPPKKDYLNYKDLQQKKKQDIKEAAERRELDRKLGFKVINPNKKKRSRRDRNDIGVVDGQIGNYRDGVQVVNKKAIARVTEKQKRRR